MIQAAAAPGRPSTLVLGLGNPLLGDDGVGPVVAAAVKARLASRADIEVDVERCGGLRLMERIAGYRHLVLVDALCTDEAVPGSVWLLGPDDVPTWNTASSHDVTLPTALRLGQEMGLAMPDRVGIVAVAARDLFDFRESLCPAVAAAVPLAVEAVLRELAVGGHATAANPETRDRSATDGMETKRTRRSPPLGERLEVT